MTSVKKKKKKQQLTHLEKTEKEFTYIHFTSKFFVEYGTLSLDDQVPIKGAQVILRAVQEKHTR